MHIYDKLAHRLAEPKKNKNYAFTSISFMHTLSSFRSRWRTRGNVSAHDIDPLRRAAALLIFHFCDICIASTAAAHSVLLGFVVFCPIFVFLQPRLCVKRGLLEKRYMVHLSCRSVRRTMLNGRMAVPDVPEVMDLLSREQETGGERVNGRVSPLESC